MLTLVSTAGRASTPGKDGPLTVVAAGTVVNEYAVLAANAAAGATSITITSGADLPSVTPGDLILIYQAQGASIGTTDTVSYGLVTGLNNAGRYEFVTVVSKSGAVITLETACGGLRHSYTASDAVQVLRVPQYTDLTITGAGSIVAPLWNGQRGGVVAIHVHGTTTVNGVIDVSGLGFRGGATSGQLSGGTTSFRTTNLDVAAEKGEGIAGFYSFYDANGGRYGRGAAANAGGGGSGHDTAGGGGANGHNGNGWTGQGVMDASVPAWATAWALDPGFIANGGLTNASGGGRGGYSYADFDQDALTVAPGNASWGGDQRQERGGLGGRPLTNLPTGRLFLGGGGGSGYNTNGLGGAGARGGGLVVLMSATVSGTGFIRANGAAGGNTTGGGFDGPGGGGGGGTVIVNADSLAGVSLEANGGSGGNQFIAPAPESEGGGGGGGGGYIAITGGVVATSVAGGIHGTTDSPSLSEFPPNGATKGASGLSGEPLTGLAICAAPNFRSIGTRGNYGTVQPEGGGTTVTATNGSDVVTGAATSWRTFNRGRGDRINILGVDYTVLWVDSETQLRLTTAYTGTTGGSKPYLIARQYSTLAAWENCVDGGPCTFFPVATTSLVADNRKEIGIAYEDSIFPLAANVIIDDSVTDASHGIVLTADGDNRHNGVPGTGVIVDGQDLPNALRVEDNYVTVEWLDFVRIRGAGNLGAIQLGSIAGGETGLVVQNVLVHNYFDAVNDVTGIRLRGGTGKDVTIRNSMIWDGDDYGIEGDEIGDTLTIENCSVDGVVLWGVHAQASALTIRNSIVTSSGTSDFIVNGGSLGGSNNTSSDASAPGANPQTGVTAAAVFVAPNLDLHLKAGANVAVDSALDLSGSFWNDIDGQSRLTLTWDRGADERGAPTAVSLTSFTAVAGDGVVLLSWETGSEMNNLGFDLYRALSEEGPYQKITTAMIPGLGTSPEGARYRYLDEGLENGRTYFYQLEDLDGSGTRERHGPVTATPMSGAELPTVPAEKSITYEDPERGSFDVVSRSNLEIVLDLVTPGFRAYPEPDGTVRLEVPGFVKDGDALLPVKRQWIDVMSGRRVEIVAVEALDVVALSLRPSGGGTLEVVAEPGGVVRLRRAARRSARAAASELARVLSVGFQGDAKRALVEMAPLRWDSERERLTLARRLRVRLSFAKPEGAETGRRRGTTPETRSLLGRLATRERGLHAVSFEAIFGRTRQSVAAASLRLSRLGQNVALHLEPDPNRFGPGSTMYFLAEGPDRNPYANELVYELSSGGGGTFMPSIGAGTGGEGVPWYLARVEREENRLYQAGLVDALDPWLWDLVPSSTVKRYLFDARSVAPSGEAAEIELWLQGGSDLSADPDHHVRVFLNGTLLDESRWDGKLTWPRSIEIPAGVLREAENALEIENVGDTEAPYSMVFLDRFAVSYPKLTIAEDGVLEGRFLDSGVAAVSGFSSRFFVLDITSATPRWLAAGFQVVSGHTYIAVEDSAVHRPEVRKPSPVRLRRESPRAEVLVIGPRSFLDAARPWVEKRRGEGLRVAFAPVEQVYEEFGFGEPRPEAVRDLIHFAYHHWRAPRLRYVLLLGDATYDFKNYLGVGVSNAVPPLIVKTDFLWTVSDPAYARVHGDDALPDVALGRLPASTEEELRGMIGKILAYESSAGANGPVVLVADDPDSGGDFDSEAEDLASGVLAARAPVRVALSTLGVSATREAIRRAFDEGSSLVSYIGHGGIHLWGNENLLDTETVASLAPLSRQPIVLTLNCLNGYFHFPYFDSLGEALVKAPEKGAIASFSPSGLSMSRPAHELHKAVMAQLFRGGSGRLGDAILEAQKEFASSHPDTDTLAIYHLLGDPTLKLPPSFRPER